MIWVTQYFKYREHSHSVTGRNHSLPRRGAHVKNSSCWTSQRYEVGMSNVGKNVHLSNPALECWSRAKCQPTGHHKVTWERAVIRISDCETRPCSEMSGESMARWGMFCPGTYHVYFICTAGDQTEIPHGAVESQISLHTCLDKIEQLTWSCLTLWSINKITLWLFNIAMGNGPFIDGLPWLYEITRWYMGFNY